MYFYTGRKRGWSSAFIIEEKSMISNQELAEMLSATAQALSLKKENAFKIKAYRRGAEAVLNHPKSIAAMVKENEDLTVIRNVGKGLSELLKEAVETGASNKLKSLKENLDPLELELLKYPGLNAKDVFSFFKKLKIKDFSEFKQALESGQLDKMGPSRRIAKIKNALLGRSRILLSEGLKMAENILGFLEENNVSRAEIAGSVRRRRETVGSLRVLVEVKDFEKLLKNILSFGPVKKLETRMKDEAIFSFSIGPPLIIARSTKKDWGNNLLRLTGSTAHLSALKKEIDINKSYSTEEELYEKGGLSFIPPELREGRHEIDAAKKNIIPKLIELKDIRGDLHMHSTYSDGSASIEEMAMAAEKKGYEYISINDHSQSLKIAGGLKPADLKKQAKEIDSLNSKLRIKILKSSEVDILADGSLDFTNTVLKNLNFTVCSIHSRFNLDKTGQTKRIISAMKNPYFKILGHATGRLLLSREGYEIDFDKVLNQAKRSKVFFEINSSPDRLDLSDENAFKAKLKGVKIAINTDAHSVRELNFMQFGVFQARRAWLTADDVLNTRPFVELKDLLVSGKAHL
jgi:DNA polymerase (family 10)